SGPRRSQGGPGGGTPAPHITHPHLLSEKREARDRRPKGALPGHSEMSCATVAQPRNFFFAGNSSHSRRSCATVAQLWTYIYRGTQLPTALFEGTDENDRRRVVGTGEAAPERLDDGGRPARADRELQAESRS